MSIPKPAEAPYNLNVVKIHNADGEDIVREDFSVSSSQINAYLTSRSARAALLGILRHLDYSWAILGCVAWFTDRDILRELMSAAKRGVGISFIVNKEDFLRPDSVKESWQEELRALYTFEGNLERHDLPGIGSELSYAGDQTIEPFRVLGIAREGRGRTRPNMHHKFIVFCKRAEPSEDILGRNLVAVSVWTGSFNPTRNAQNSLENAVLIHDEKIAKAFLSEYEQNLALSEPCDWSGEYIEPEWRIGT